MWFIVSQFWLRIPEFSISILEFSLSISELWLLSHNSDLVSQNSGLLSQNSGIVSQNANLLSQNSDLPSQRNKKNVLMAYIKIIFRWPYWVTVTLTINLTIKHCVWGFWIIVNSGGVKIQKFVGQLHMAKQMINKAGKHYFSKKKCVFSDLLKRVFRKTLYICIKTMSFWLKPRFS